MSEEVQAVEVQTAEVPAPEQVDTASPVTEEVTPEQKAEETPKTFTQEELDAIVSKRLAREQRKWEREQQQHAEQRQQVNPESLTREQFGSDGEFLEAMADLKANQKIAERERQARQRDVISSYHEREEVARDKYDDFQQVAYNPKLPITEVMAESIQSSDIGPDVAYYLGSNPKEAERISRLAPIVQAKEIGRIEAKLAAEPPSAKKTSSAPAPISPVTPSSKGQSSFDTTDPRAIKSMSDSEWIEAERQRQRKNLEARRH